MFENVLNLINLSTYAVIFGIGLVVLGVSAIFGGDADMDADMDVDMDVDVDADTGHGTKWLNIKVMSAFATAFGGGGAIAQIYKMSNGKSLITAILAGLLIAVVAKYVLDIFYKQQASSTISAKDFVDKKGSVVTTIFEGKIGEVKIQLGLLTEKKSAKSHDGAEIKQGEEIVVVSAGSPLIVRKASYDYKKL